MCSCSYVYTVTDLEKMTAAQLGQAVWEYINDPIISEMVESYGGIEEAAQGAVECFADGEKTETATYLLSLGTAALVEAVSTYLQIHS